VRTGDRTTIGRHCHWQFRLEQLRKEIAIGIDQGNRGQVKPAEEVFHRLRKRNKQASRKKK
jgi:hypothetical protein